MVTVAFAVRDVPPEELGLFELVTVTVFVYDPAGVAAVVGLVTCTTTLWPEARVNEPVLPVPVPQLSVWPGRLSAGTAHVTPEGKVLVEAMVQVVPAGLGSGSLSVTLYALPVPLALLLDSVIVKPTF